MKFSEFKNKAIFQFLKQLPVIGRQVLGIGHPVHPSKPPGQYTSSSPQGIGHTLEHFTPSIPSGAIFHEIINVLHARKESIFTIYQMQVCMYRAYCNHWHLFLHNISFLLDHKELGMLQGRLVVVLALN